MKNSNSTTTAKAAVNTNPAHFWKDRERNATRLRKGRHLPVCGPNDATPEGVRWTDMPGAEEIAKRFDFFLHIPGLYPGWRDANGRWMTKQGHANRKRRLKQLAESKARQEAVAV